MTPDELAMAVAATVATVGTEAAVASGGRAVGALVRLVRDRLARRGGDDRALRDAIEHPDDRQRVAALADALLSAMAEDPALAGRLREILPPDAAPAAAGDGAVNHFSGHAATVVQARDIHGGISL
ncbi:hypothetical protein AB0H83_01440 [Dactylosporangium sp. NPDC050688]|uniref:hypothetical protein n=1 Tax=Dactylosporangium sp. NPDC050688 TaxID=3157217 RepID=UPI0033D1344E